MATKQERIDSLKAQLSRIEERKKEIAGKIRNLNKPTKTERKARTHRLCTIGGIVEKIEKRAIEDFTAFETYYLSLKKTTAPVADERTLRLQKIGQLVEASAGRKIEDMSVFEEYIKTQSRWIKG